MKPVGGISVVSDLALQPQTLARAGFAIHGSLTSLTGLQCGITDSTDLTDGAAAADRYTVMVLTLSGEPTPPLPDVPGRRCHGLAGDPHDRLREQWEQDHQKLAPGWWGPRP